MQCHHINHLKSNSYMKIRQLAELKGYIFECFSLVLQNIFVTVESAEGFLGQVSPPKVGRRSNFQLRRKRSIRRILSGQSEGGRSSGRDNQAFGIDVLWQEGLALGVGSCRRQELEEVTQITVRLQAVGLGGLDEGVQGGRGVGPAWVA